MVAKDEDIEQSLKLLLLTVPGERVMHPEFGCGIRSMVFDTMDTATIIRELVKEGRIPGRVVLSKKGAS